MVLSRILFIVLSACSIVKVRSRMAVNSLFNTDQLCCRAEFC
jgi:hypothetical protein